jgi:NAD(P)H-hydrate epimerase
VTYTPALPPPLAVDAHKGEAGTVLALSGSETMPGAALLAARAAQRGGAGLVAQGCLDANLLLLVPVAAPEAVLIDLTECWDRSGRELGDARARLAERKPSAVLVGPGLGSGARTRAVVELALALCAVPLVLDADALNVFAGEPERLRAARGPLVLTPHPGEAARLLGHDFGRDEAARAAAARELAQRSGAIVCLKGAGTLVVATGGEPWRNPSGNPGLATAGAGDVLAGLLAAYLARCAFAPGWTPLDAARAAVFVHGRAGDLAAAHLGRRALVASDVIEALAAAQREIDAL